MGNTISEERKRVLKDETSTLVIWENDDEDLHSRFDNVIRRKNKVNSPITFEERFTIEDPNETDSTEPPSSTLSEFSPITTRRTEIEGKESDWLVHRVTGKETLQGLSLKYGVEIAAIKKINRLWSSDHIFGRKEILIPTTKEEYMEFRSEKAITTTTPKEPFDLDNVKRQQMILQFIEITQQDESVAIHYLEEKSWNFSRALGLYFAQGTTEESPVPNPKSKSYERGKGKEEIDEIWPSEEPQPSKSDNPYSQNGFGVIYNPAPVYLSSKSDSGVGKVKRRVKERLAQRQNELFEI